ncbi:flavin reductase family protein [Sphingobacterium detergens]
MKTYSLKVVNIKLETPDTVTLCFKQPGLRKIKYSPGQYLTLIFRINGRRYLRPYSFSSAPSVDATLDVTIKRVHHGIISNHIHDQVKIGDVVEVLEPMGDFGSNVISQEELFLWGVGSGITPLISIAKELLFHNSNIKIHLIYGNRDVDQTIFLQLIQSLETNYGDRFNVIYFYTKLAVKPNLPYWVQGRISRESILEIMRNRQISGVSHLICGPFGLKESLVSTLLELGFSKEEIFSEDFELIKDPMDFVDINTQHVHVQFGEQKVVLEVIKGQTILESALDAGIDLPYSCQTGSCNTCKAKVLQGTVKIIGIEKERSDLEDNETLLCCSHPTSEDVIIKI